MNPTTQINDGFAFSLMAHQGPDGKLQITSLASGFATPDESAELAKKCGELIEAIFDKKRLGKPFMRTI